MILAARAVVLPIDMGALRSERITVTNLREVAADVRTKLRCLQGLRR